MRDFSRRTAVAGLAGGLAVTAHPALLANSGSHTGSTVLNLTDFGVSPSATPLQNLARLKDAIANAPSGATLYLPRTGPLACAIDTRGGWTGAVQIDKPLTLRIDGALQATHSALRPNPPFILNVTAPGVTISGSGRIIGDGSIDDTNAGIDENLPGLIRVAADDFTMTGVEMVTPPKVGLMLYQCRRARIEGARFTGGPKVYGDTSHFAIRAAGGGQHVFNRNRFYPAADGGMCVQCIMLAGANDSIITDNHATHPYEKLVYAFGDRNIARNNVVVGNPDFIPGTNIQGTITGVFRFHGSSNRVEGNRSSNCAGGAQMMDGTAHTVVGNRFMDCGQSAISAYRSDLSGSTFRGNVGTRGNLIGFVVGDGMRLISDNGPARGVTVEDNDISGFSVSDPIAAIQTLTRHRTYGRNSLVKPGIGNGRFYEAQNAGTSGPIEPQWPDRPGAVVLDGTIRWVTIAYEGGQAEIKLSGRDANAPIADSLILKNRTSGGRLGIVTQFVTRSRISGNNIAASEWAMVEEVGDRNVWQGNVLSGPTNRAVRNLARTSSLLK